LCKCVGTCNCKWIYYIFLMIIFSCKSILISCECMFSWFLFCNGSSFGYPSTKTLWNPSLSPSKNHNFWHCLTLTLFYICTLNHTSVFVFTLTLFSMAWNKFIWLCTHTSQILHLHEYKWISNTYNRSVCKYQIWLWFGFLLTGTKNDSSNF
jgi:hypothetical protein